MLKRSRNTKSCMYKLIVIPHISDRAEIYWCHTCKKKGQDKKVSSFFVLWIYIGRFQPRQGLTILMT